MWKIITKYRNASSLTLVRCEACTQAIILNTNPPYLVLCTVRLPKKALEFSELWSLDWSTVSHSNLVLDSAFERPLKIRLLWMVKIPICFLPYVIFDSKHEHLVNSKKERVTQSKNKAKTTQIVHAPFTCYQSIQKKKSDLNSIHKSTTLTCQHISLFWEVEKRAGKLDKNISPMP